MKKFLFIVILFLPFDLLKNSNIIRLIINLKEKK